MWHETWNWDMGWGWFGAMHLLWLVVLLAVVVMIASFAAARRTKPPSDTDQSFNILRERYARGEIDAREYEERTRRLSESRAPRE